MHSIQSQYLDILIPGFNSLAPSIKNQFENEEIWQELIRQIGMIEEESKETYHFWFTKINEEKVQLRLNAVKDDFQVSFQPMLQAIALERYPFLKFLQENHIHFSELTPQQVVQHINHLKTPYFQYRFANIPFLENNQDSLNFWNTYFEIPTEHIDSIESLHECIRILEVTILQNWIFSKIEPVIGPLLRNEEELYLQINKLSQNISQNPQQEEIFQPVIQYIQNQVCQTLAYSLPATKQIKATYTQMFRDILGSMIENMPSEIAEIADVHAIIQASGFSTQNEYSHLAILDFVNYFKYTKEIKNFKSISSAFMRPLLPLYWELVYISKQPQNIINIIRLILPLMLLTGYLIAIETLLSTVPSLIALMNILHAPEVAMILTMVISIYVGLVLMSYFYENVKITHQFLTELYYGDRYKTPVYQVNERMQSMFGNNLAQEVRKFYTELMKNLDVKIQELEHQAHHTGLNEQKIQTQKTSEDTRKKLELEWMAVHHLTKYATDKAKEHVKIRLQEQIKEKYEIYKTTKDMDLNVLSDTLHESMLANNASISLFQPKCLNIKNEIEALENLRNRIS